MPKVVIEIEDDGDKAHYSFTFTPHMPDEDTESLAHKLGLAIYHMLTDPVDDEEDWDLPYKEHWN